MSRPSVISENSMQNNQRIGRIIDFANAPMPPQFSSLSTCAYEDPYGHSPYSYSMVGAQGAYGMPPPPSIPVGSLYPTGAPGFIAAQQARPLQAYHTVDAPPPCISPRQSISTRVTEDELDHKINTQINSIMAAHKAETLCNKVEKLTDKVQMLSRNMEMAQMNNSMSSDFPTTSTSHGSRMESSYEEPSMHSSGRVGVSAREDDISYRLRKLAAESNKRVGRKFVHDY
jgi:hypothetical protein